MSNDNNELQKKIGERFKIRREIMGYSQTTVAHKLGYADRSMIAKIESGKVEVPLSKLEIACKVLDMTMDYATGKSEHNYEEKPLTESDYNSIKAMSLMRKLSIEQQNIIIQLLEDMTNVNKLS